MKNAKDLLVPVIRAKVGDWWFYVATLTFGELAERVKRVDEIQEKMELKTWIQRDIKAGRTEEISEYIRTQPQLFFNGIVLGLFDGEPQWYPIDVSKSPAMPEVELSERVQTAFGLVHLSGTEQIFAIDGQHRVEGIKHALKTGGAKLKEEEQTVIFVSHKTTDEGRERTRRLFTTLNKYAKPVTKGEIIALSEDDTFAVVTRRLIDSYAGLGSEFVPLTSPNLPVSDKKSLTSLITLYEVVKTISLSAKRGEKGRLETGPPNAKEIDEFYQNSVQFWDALKQCVPEIKEICASDADEEIAAKYRNKQGGHLLLRPFGLAIFAKAVRVLINRDLSIDSAVAELCQGSLEISEDPWRHIIWNPVKNTFTAKSGALVKNLLLVTNGHKTDPSNFDVQDAYLNAIGEVQTDYRPPQV